MAEAGDGSKSYAVETMEEVKTRHKKELKTLDGACRKMLKQANKNKAKTAEAEKKIIKMEQDIKDRHMKELIAAEGASASTSSETGDKSTIPDAPGDGVGDDSGQAQTNIGGRVEAVAEGMSVMSIEEREKEKRDQKRAKAQRKRERQRNRELEREERIEKEKREGGPDPRILEMEILGAQVAPRGLKVSEIKADGHCLYRAVAEQLGITGRRSALTEDSYLLMRQETARELRSSPTDYLPFMDGVEEGEEFEAYCGKVEGSAEWGGQLELQALSSALAVPMEVFSATSPPLLLGEGHGGPSLRLTYHEHYYALGAHYNSVVPS